MVNILMAIGMILDLMSKAQKIGGAISKARAEGRDITDEELADIKKSAIKAREDLEKELGL